MITDTTYRVIIIALTLILIGSVIFEESPKKEEKPKKEEPTIVLKKADTPKRHPFVIHSKTMTSNEKFPFEYGVDFMPGGSFLSGKNFAVGDTVQFTTMKQWREYQELRAEIVRRDAAWKDIKETISSKLNQYK